MKRKINRRLRLVTLLAILIVSIGIILVFYGLFEAQVKKDLRTNVKLLTETQALTNTDPRFESLHEDKLRITWIAADGTVLYDNDTDAAVLPNHLDRPEIADALVHGEGESVRRSDTFGINTFYYAHLLPDGTILRLSTQARAISGIFLAALPVILLIAAAVFFICMFIGRALTNQLMKPIAEMTEKLDSPLQTPVYEELAPFAEKIRTQHENILEAAKIRQEFTANVSHELKTPVTAISGYAQLMETEMVSSEQIPHIAGQIHDNADRLQYLINDILALSELDDANLERSFEEVDLYALAQRCCEKMQIHAAGSEILLTCMGSATVVRGVEELLSELLQNLVQNAIRYNTQGGYVIVSVGSENGHAALQVKDNGIGIPEEAQPHIFERFYRVDKSRSKESGGTGLGLAIVKHIAQIHHAEIRLESEAGKGTEVTVVF